MLSWEKLLCDERQRKSTSSSNTTNFIKRNEFESDYDRIIGSSSVRRLQDKAQVFPLQENDLTRTRLTHSIEVSALARSLGKAVGTILLQEGKMEPEQVEQLQALLQTIGLIHDLGNPPFGHYGESVIRKWFEEYFESNKPIGQSTSILSKQQKNDFLFFDGNVQNIRIITKLQTQNDIFGANFTYGTIASVIKYPWDSTNDKCCKGKKKFGYYESEASLVKEIRAKMELHDNECHPATLLMEAADDIIYICDDIEDGVKKGYIDWNQTYNDLKKTIPEYQDLFDSIDAKIPDNNMTSGEKTIANSRNFRNATQSFLFAKAVENFISYYNDIMNNNFKKDLLFTEEELLKTLKKITAKTCFASKEVIGLELAGDKVISVLLDTFLSVILEHTAKDLLNTTTYAGKVFSLISPNFIFVALHKYMDNSIQDIDVRKETALDKLSLYEKLHLVVDFVSGMTDSYAVNVYKELMGISLA